MADGKRTDPAATESEVEHATDVPLTSHPRTTRLLYQPTPLLRPLKEEVLELIAPWRDSSERPPFSAGESIVIMLILNNERRQRLSEIHILVLETYKYFLRQSVRAYNHQIAAEVYHWDDERIPHVVPGFFEVVMHFDHPCCVGNLEHNTPEDPTELSDAAFEVRPSAARLYLRDRLEQRPRQGAFDFMGLAAELREKIYKMLMLYPEPGLTLDEEDRAQDDTKTRVGVYSTSDEDFAEYRSWGVRGNYIEVESPAKTLAILGVSKQIRNEALPIFYGRNAFLIGSLDLLQSRFRLMSSETLQQIRNLRVVMEHRGLCQETRPLQGLEKLLGDLAPKKLALMVPRNTEFWTYCGGIGHEYRTSPRPVNMYKLRYIKALDGIVSVAQRAESLKIVGDAFLVPWLRKTIGKGE
ncbi:hypothetical protein CKM354_001011100 [Cercospora kikuchii]|uniref:DUF7730 domain-containing protein n=1 Tax=Cercospora kikuchii TaxID=84275 RepID=A0A9P3FKF2_9PEZI|nr:uncharacterized protein CKM354_001011100 [Cercospora kikuchii]GIZ47009.1 hypothetical protein CKM354_001011100 [Cercospora kikuchii]